MFGTYSGNPAASYARVGVETGVSTADPHRLVLMLFDGAILTITSAGSALSRGAIAARGEAISKAIEIIANGLKASLDTTAGGELAERLAALYDYMCERLLYANIHGSQAALDEVSGLLHSLRDAWQNITPQAQKTA